MRKSIFGVGKTNYGLADSSLGGEGNPFNKTVKTSSKKKSIFLAKLIPSQKKTTFDPLGSIFLAQTNKS